MLINMEHHSKEMSAVNNYDDRKSSSSLIIDCSMTAKCYTSTPGYILKHICPSQWSPGNQSDQVIISIFATSWDQVSLITCVVTVISWEPKWHMKLYVSLSWEPKLILMWVWAGNQKWSTCKSIFFLVLCRTNNVKVIWWLPNFTGGRPQVPLCALFQAWAGSRIEPQAFHKLAG